MQYLNELVTLVSDETVSRVLCGYLEVSNDPTLINTARRPGILCLPDRPPDHISLRT